jgi:hypothetical protein
MLCISTNVLGSFEDILSTYYKCDLSDISCKLIVTGHMYDMDSAVGIATGYALDNRGSDFESQKDQEFSLLHVVQTGSGAPPTSYPMGTWGSFPKVKEARA